MSGKQAKRKRNNINEWVVALLSDEKCPYCGQSICDDDQADIVIMNQEALNIIRHRGLNCLQN